MDRKRKLVTALQVRLLNPPIRALAARGLAPGLALLETTGRKSGEPRRTPVSNGLQRGTNTFWIVAEMGHEAAYVRNIVADPRVRIPAALSRETECSRARGSSPSSTCAVPVRQRPRTRIRTRGSATMLRT